MATVGRPRATARRIAQREIAARAGVSVSSVSRVLNNLAGISPEVQQRVLAAAAELGHPGHASSERDRLRLRRIGLFAVNPYIKPVTGDFYGDMLIGIEAECRRQGLHLSYATVAPGLEGRAFVLDTIRDNDPDGLLFLAADDRALLERVLALGLPAAVINAEHPALPIDTFLPDNEVGPRLAVRHLVDRGHRRILHVSQPTRPTLQRRHDAVRAALAEAGLRGDEAPIIEAPMAVDATHEALRGYLAAAPPAFTAVVCANDLMAIGAIRALQGAGRRVPEDVSVIGYDDLALATLLTPPLTTVRIEREELGALAVRRLLERAADPGLTPIRVDLATRLVERRSVAAAGG